MILSLKCCLISIFLISFVDFSMQNAVPSSKNPGDAAREYCKEFGWKPEVKSQQSKVKGFRAAEIGQFPTIAALYSVNKIDGLKESRYICVGSLISDKFIVTAAHCMKRTRGLEGYFARLGRVS